jgi:predicted transcriptional regulator
MSDMGRSKPKSKRISVRLSPQLSQRLKREAVNGKAESEVVREALEDYFKRPAAVESCYDAFLRLGLIGAAKGLPRDLSTNRKYFKGFGE